MSKDELPFDCVERAFQRECEDRNPLTVVMDMALLGEPLSRPVPLTELRSLLLRPEVEYEVRDAILNELADLARDGGQRWMVGLIGMLLPGLRRALLPLTENCPDLRADVQSEALADVVATIGRLPSGRHRLAGRLIGGAYVRGRRLVKAELAARGRVEQYDEDVPCAYDWSPHPDLLLAELLAEARRVGVLDEDDVDLIGRTRLGGTSLHRYAIERGQSETGLTKRRLHAERQLREWLHAS